MEESLEAGGDSTVLRIKLQAANVKPVNESILLQQRWVSFRRYLLPTGGVS